MVKEIQEILKEAEALLCAVVTPQGIVELRSRYLGKNGKFTSIAAAMKTLEGDARRIAGAEFNNCKKRLESLFLERQSAIEQEALARSVEEDWVDIGYRESNIFLKTEMSGYHPNTLVQREIEDIFLSMGFEILDGPHIETDYYNFEALNVPADHPARDMQDTFWFSDLRHLLRTHTSPVQVRGMEVRKPPFKFIAPGTCFRCERTDASHEMIFNQLEGMMVGPDVSVAHLIHFMTTLLREVFRQDVKIRLRPGFFPFVEPGFELDIGCLICEAKGCSVCKQSGWLELLPCGMVHPQVLRYGKIDADKYSGFAFGLGLDRLVMMKYQINDIRLIHSGDLRFIKQFAAF